MTRSIRVTLTDELGSFLDQNCGEGTLFPTAGEFVRNLLREKKERQEAAAIRQAVLEGFQDVQQGRVTEYRGSLSDLLKSRRPS